MIHAIVLLQLFGASHVYVVASVAVEHKNDPVFFADVDGAGIADLVVQDGYDLHIRLDGGTERHIAIPESVAAYDIVNIDDDAASEIVAVRGREVLALELATSTDKQSPAQLLFQADSLYAMGTDAPCRQVLVKTFQQKLVVLLPKSESLTAFALDGSIVAEFPNLPDAPRYAPEFHSSAWYDFGGLAPGTNSTVVWQAKELIPDLPPELQPPQLPLAITHNKPADSNIEPPLSARFSFDNGEYKGSWDGVIVSRDTNSVRYAMLRSDENGNTLAFMREVPLTSEGEDWTNATNGPVRRYPGRILSRYRWSANDTLSERSDFNGDGFMDLILWDAPKPGMSVESIMRTVVSRSWPIRMTVHLYSPDKQRFEPKPAYAINCKVPVTWFLAHGPFENLILADFDGDQKTDIALGTDENEIQVWLAADGFSRDPDWSHTFPEPIEETLQTVDLSGKGRTSILLRGEKNLYLLQAR